MAEIYDADSNPYPLTQRLVNLSGRGGVAAANLLIGGFVIGGTAAKSVLIRAAGPALANYGISGPLGTPVLSIYNAAACMLARTPAGATRSR